MVSGVDNGFVSQGRNRKRQYESQNMHCLRTSHAKLVFFSAKAASFVLLSALLTISPDLALSQEQRKQPKDDLSKDPDSPITTSKNEISPQNDSPQDAHSLDEYDNTWTFSNPGVSYMDFSPMMRDDQGQHYSLSFRTLRPNGLLLQQHIPGLEGTPISSVLSRYQLFLELRQGSLRAGFIMNHYQDFITTGKGKKNRGISKSDCKRSLFGSKIR